MSSPAVLEPPLPIGDVPNSEEFSESVIMIYYGSGGTGKTEFLGTVGKDGIVLSCGAGAMTLSSPGFQSRYKGNVPKLVHLREEINHQTGMFKKAEAWDKFTDFCDWFLQQEDYKTLCVDDATHLAIFARNKGMEANQELGIGAPMTKANAMGFPILEVQEYQKELGILTWFFLHYFPHFQARKKNFILAAHERHIYTKPINSKGAVQIGQASILTKILPGFTGEKLPYNIQNYFDFVWRAELANGTVFRAKTQSGVGSSGGEFECKTRWGGVFPVEIKNPNFSKILACLRSGKKWEEPR